MTIHVGPVSRHDERRCPKCGHKLDASCAFGQSPVDDPRGPKAGDFVVCGGCTGLFRYDERLTIRSLTSAELCGLKADGTWETLERGRAAWRATFRP